MLAMLSFLPGTGIQINAAKNTNPANSTAQQNQNILS